MEKMRTVIVTRTTDENFQKLLEDMEIAKELQKIVESQYFSESYQSLVDKIKPIIWLVEKESTVLQKFYNSPKDELKKEIINFVLRQTFSRCIDNNLNLNVREDVLNQLRNEKNVKKIVDEVSIAKEDSLRTLICELITSRTGPLGELFTD